MPTDLEVIMKMLTKSQIDFKITTNEEFGIIRITTWADDPYANDKVAFGFDLNGNLDIVIPYIP